MNTIARQITVVLEVPELPAKVCLLTGRFTVTTRLYAEWRVIHGGDRRKKRS